MFLEVCSFILKLPCHSFAGYQRDFTLSLISCIALWGLFVLMVRFDFVMISCPVVFMLSFPSFLIVSPVSKKRKIQPKREMYQTARGQRSESSALCYVTLVSMAGSTSTLLLYEDVRVCPLNTRAQSRCALIARAQHNVTMLTNQTPREYAWVCIYNVGREQGFPWKQNFCGFETSVMYHQKLLLIIFDVIIQILVYYLTPSLVQLYARIFHLAKDA